MYAGGICGADAYYGVIFNCYNTGDGNSNNEEEKGELVYGSDLEQFSKLIMDNHISFFQEKIIHNGFKKAFKAMPLILEFTIV